MPIAGLVITTLPKVALSSVALVVSRVAGVEVGACTDGRVAVVLESETLDEHRQRVSQLEALEGVAVVEVAYFDFEDVTSGPALPSAMPRVQSRTSTEIASLPPTRQGNT